MNFYRELDSLDMANEKPKEIKRPLELQNLIYSTKCRKRAKSLTIEELMFLVGNDDVLSIYLKKLLSAQAAKNGELLNEIAILTILSKNCLEDDISLPLIIGALVVSYNSPYNPHLKKENRKMQELINKRMQYYESRLKRSRVIFDRNLTAFHKESGIFGILFRGKRINIIRKALLRQGRRISRYNMAIEKYSRLQHDTKPENIKSSYLKYANSPNQIRTGVSGFRARRP